MTATISALIWDDKTVFARKHGLTETEESERKVRLFGLAPGVSASIGEIKSTVEGYCKTRGVDYFSVNVNANNRNNKFAIVVTKTNEDRDRLVGSGFGIIAGNGVIINTKPENEQERNDRKYGKQLQLAALPTNENAAALEECRQWIGAKSVQIPPNPYTETKGSVAIFEFETTQQVDMIINDEESRKVDLSDGKLRTLFRTWKKNGNAFERVQLCWGCGNGEHRKSDCTLGTGRTTGTTERDLLDFATGTRMGFTKEKQIKQFITKSMIRGTNIFGTNAFAASAAAKRAGVATTPEGRMAATLAQGPKTQTPTGPTGA
ncbi:hypothetical protein HDU98_004135, partial [Podochytrium sp. JEL0797]